MRSLHTKMKFSVKDFLVDLTKFTFFLWIWLDLLNKYLIENSIFCKMGFFLSLEFYFISPSSTCNSYMSLEKVIKSVKKHFYPA